MKKVLGKATAIIFAGFCLAVLALLMSLTYSALQKLFPNNPGNQMWGLVMFDIAAICWGLAFVYQCKSTMQYAVAAMGFVVAFVGTLGMVAAEVMLSGQNLAQINTVEIGRWMVYGFIIVTAIHAALVYAHHGSAPEISEQINVGIARGEIVTYAIEEATKELDAEKHRLAQDIKSTIVAQVKRDLNLYPVTGTIFEPRVNDYHPAEVQQVAPSNAELLQKLDRELNSGEIDQNAYDTLKAQIEQDIAKEVTEGAKAQDNPLSLKNIKKMFGKMKRNRK